MTLEEIREQLRVTGVAVAEDEEDRSRVRFWLGEEAAEARAKMEDGLRRAILDSGPKPPPEGKTPTGFWKKRRAVHKAKAEGPLPETLADPPKKSPAKWIARYRYQLHTEGGAILLFGKFKGRTIAAVGAEEPGYLRWILSEGLGADDPVWMELVEKALSGAL